MVHDPMHKTKHKVWPKQNSLWIHATTKDQGTFQCQPLMWVLSLPARQATPSWVDPDSSKTLLNLEMKVKAMRSDKIWPDDLDPGRINEHRVKNQINCQTLPAKEWTENECSAGTILVDHPSQFAFPQCLHIRWQGHSSRWTRAWDLAAEHGV